jgi:uncharacterized membrane protein
MSEVKKFRIESIDLLRGVVMVIMALDHVRDYFHINALGVNDPTNLETTTPILFFTRFITHYCAPTFVFLAGTSAFLYGRNKSKKELFKFLFTRGLWLIFVEIVIMNFLWWFDIHFDLINLQVIWAIGLSMILLSLLIYLPPKIILGIGLLLLFGHNLLDGITFQGNDPVAILWYILHQNQFIQLDHRMIGFYYPILPWIGVMSLGYLFGNFYGKDFDVALRKRWLLRFGFGAIVLFLIIRGINVYGDLVPWTEQKNATYTFLSFMNVSKYPPSLAYILVTLGPGMLFLYATENIQNKITRFFLVFGRVPFFYYVLHIFIIHLAALLLLIALGDDWTKMILTSEFLSPNSPLNGYGYSLGITYLVWIIIVLLLYYPCLKYMKYKAAHRDKWWLSYL